MEIDFSNTNGFSGPRYNILVIRSIYLYLLLWLFTNKTGYEWVGYACVCRPKDSPRGRRERGALLGATLMVWEKDYIEGMEKKVVYF